MENQLCRACNLLCQLGRRSELCPFFSRAQFAPVVLAEELGSPWAEWDKGGDPPPAQDRHRVLPSRGTAARNIYHETNKNIHAFCSGLNCLPGELSWPHPIPLEPFCCMRMTLKTNKQINTRRNPLRIRMNLDLTILYCPSYPLTANSDNDEYLMCRELIHKATAILVMSLTH